MSDTPSPATPTPTPSPPSPEPNSPPTPPPTEPPEPRSPLNEDTAPAPEPFDESKLTLPENFEKNEAFTEFTKWAAENKIAHGVSQKAIDMHIAALKAHEERIIGAWHDQQAQWLDQIKNDPELSDMNAIRQTFARVADNTELSDPEFRKALDFTGAGMHPAVVRTLNRWAKALSEGGSVAGNPAPRDNQGNVDTRRDPGRALYGETGPHSGGPKLS